MRLLYTALLVLFIPLTFLAAVEASYVREPVLFFEPSSGELPTDTLIAKLGTLTLRDNPIHHPHLVTDPGGHVFEFTGLISSGIGQSDFQIGTALFYLYAVSTTNHGTKAVKLEDPDGNHALRPRQGNVGSPFIAHLYLVSAYHVSRFKLGSTYTLSDGVWEDFTVGAADDGSGYNPGSDPLVPVDDEPAENPTPFLPPGTSSDDPIIYGDPSEIVDCTFSIINEQAFELDQACNGGSAVVATAQIHLSNVGSDKTYGVRLTFTNATDTPPFLMTLQESMSNPPTIKYKLLFDNTNPPLEPGDWVDWEGLTDGLHSKDIYVTGINPTEAQTCLSGSYSDTVYVTITPIDSQ